LLLLCLCYILLLLLLLLSLLEHLQILPYHQLRHPIFLTLLVLALLALSLLALSPLAFSLLLTTLLVEGGLQKSETTLSSCRGYLEVDYWGNSLESKLYCWGKSSAFIYAQGI